MLVSSRLAAALATLAMSLGVVHCDKSAAPPPPAKLGEPVGVRVDDVKDPSGKKLGSLQAAFAISEGTAAEPLVPGMARVLARIGSKCPALLAKGLEPLHLRGKTSAGKLKFGPAAPAESAEVRCFRDAMDGERISESPLEVDIAIELRPESGT